MGRRRISLLFMSAFLLSLSCSWVQSRPQYSGSDGDQFGNGQDLDLDSDSDLDLELSKRSPDPAPFGRLLDFPVYGGQGRGAPGSWRSPDADLDADADFDLELRKRSPDPRPFGNLLGFQGTRDRRQWWQHIPGVGHVAAAYYRSRGNNEAADQASQRANAGFNIAKNGLFSAIDKVGQLT